MLQASSAALAGGVGGGGSPVGTGRQKYLVYILGEVLRGRSSSSASIPGHTGLWQ